MRTNVRIAWHRALDRTLLGTTEDLETTEDSDSIPSHLFQKTQANEMVYTMHCLNAKAFLTFRIGSKGELYLNSVNWQKTTQRKKPEGLENIDLETKKALLFFYFLFMYDAETTRYMHYFDLSEQGVSIECQMLNEEGEKAFRKLYEMQFIIHSKLDIKEDANMSSPLKNTDFEISIYSKCILDPFVKEIVKERIMEDYTLPSHLKLYELYSSECITEDEE